MNLKTGASLGDDDLDESSVQRIVPAQGAARPITSAPNSVFDAGRKAKAATTPPAFTADQIVIRKGIPKPPVRSGAASTYLAVLQQMQPGDSVELPTRQADGFYARAKEFAKAATPPQQYSRRKVSATTAAIWRDA